MKRTLIVSALTLALAAGGTGIAQAEPGDSQVVGNGTFQVIHADGSLGPVQHGRHVYTMGNGEGVRMTQGSCKSVDADGTTWGPIWVGDRRQVSCYGANWES